jgi:CSLREA domain-containing protein
MRALSTVKFGVFLVCFLFVLGVSLVAPQPAYAAPIEVNVNYDSSTNPDSDPGTDDPNDCSLREAIQNANDDAQTYPDCPAGSGADIITFAGSVTSITFDDQIFITTELTINGVVTFDGNNAARFFTVQAVPCLTLNSVT